MMAVVAVIWLKVVVRVDYAVFLNGKA